MREINKRELLKGIGTVGSSALTISGIGAAEPGQDTTSEPLDDEEITELLRGASDERPFRAMYAFLLRNGYVPDWSETMGREEEIGSTERPVLITPFEDFYGETAEFIVRFDADRNVGVQALIPQGQGYNSYYSSGAIIERFGNEVIDQEQFQQYEQRTASVEDVTIGCETVGGAEICAAIGVLGAAGGVTVSLLSPIPGDEAAAIATLGKVETLVTTSCGIAELIDGYINCEPDRYKVCLKTANLFFPYVTIKPLC